MKNRLIRGKGKLVIALKYAVFAALATAANIGIQRICLAIYEGPYSLWIAMLCGTATGLLLKYVLDKKYIFRFIVHNKREDVYKFILYSFMGIVTTALFWGTEYCFDLLLSFLSAKYLGALIGLSVGYTAKYFLDKRFVFPSIAGSGRVQDLRKGP